MVERKLFKTKLCVLYQRGHCNRQNCSFAHGNVELRQFRGSYSGKQDYRVGDLRDKLDQRFSPRRRRSPERDARGRHRFRGSSPSRSFERNSSQKRRKKQQFDGQSDFSESLKVSYGAGDQVNERKSTSDSRGILQEQLQEVRSDIAMLDHRKSQLRILVEEKFKEADSLSARIQELNAQLSHEKEDCKRIDSKVKKFVRAHKRYVRAQDDVTRSQVQLQKVGDQLGSGIIITGGHEEDSSINIVSDGEATGYHAIIPQNEVQKNNSPSKRSSFLKGNVAGESMREDRRFGTETDGYEKQLQLNTHPTHLNINKEFEVVDSRGGGHRPSAAEVKQKKVQSVSSSICLVDKLKGSGSGLLVPSTSMAAHAFDELVEIEGEKNIDLVEAAAAGLDKVALHKLRKSLISVPPPPPVPRNAYSQYVGEDSNVDVDGLEEEMGDVDIV